MKRSTFDESRDQRIAKESGADRALMCCATGCPNRWSCDPPRACLWHSAAEPHLWPQITQEQLHAETDRAMRSGQPLPVARRLTQDEKSAIVQSLRTLASSTVHPRAWAHKLREREQGGERLSGPQRAAWREVLGAQEAAA